MKISIALCTYNGGKFLKQQLESFLKQTRMPDEIVIGDDCSTDETIKIIEDYRQKFPLSVCLHINEKNLGSNENFERTVSRCTGDLIFLSDQDDIWLPDKIAEMEKIFLENPSVGLVFSDAKLINEKGKSLGLNLWNFTFTQAEQHLIKNGKGFEVLLRRNVITGATAAFRSGLRKYFLPFDKSIPNLIHDGWIALISSLYSQISFTEKCLILYRQHEQQQIGIDWMSKKSNGSILSKFSRKHTERTNWFDYSINFLQKEINRIEITTESLKKRENPNYSDKSLDKLKKEFLDEKSNHIAHLKQRRNLPKNRLKRVFPVIKEALTGRYHIFSRGKHGIGRDLFEKWK